MNYNKAFKHASVISKSASNSREILQGIKHHGKNIIATDSHRLLISTDSKVNFDEHIISSKTGDLIEGNFPDVSRLIDNDNYSIDYLLEYEHIENIRKMLKAAKTMKFEMLNIVTYKESDNIIFKAINTDPHSNLKKMNLSYTPFLSEIDKDEIIYRLNLNYMIDLFDFLYETKKETTIKIDSNIKPVHFTSNDYTYLILPIRTD